MIFLLPLLSALISYLICTDVGEYAWYLSQYQVEVARPRGSFDPSPHLDALRWALHQGRRAGAIYGSLGGYFGALVAVHRGLRWWSVPIGIVVAMTASATGAYLRII